MFARLSALLPEVVHVVPNTDIGHILHTKTSQLNCFMKFSFCSETFSSLVQ
jgi:hypothetical protein